MSGTVTSYYQQCVVQNVTNYIAMLLILMWIAWWLLGERKEAVNAHVPPDHRHSHRNIPQNYELYVLPVVTVPETVELGARRLVNTCKQLNSQLLVMRLGISVVHPIFTPLVQQFLSFVKIQVKLSTYLEHIYPKLLLLLSLVILLMQKNHFSTYNWLDKTDGDYHYK